MLGKSLILLFILVGKIEVLSVYDGDSFNLKTSEGFKVKARLVGIDCPEMGRNGRKGYKAQAGAERAKLRLKELLDGDVRVAPLGHDPFGRSLVEVFDKYGRLINEILILEGICEAYRGKIQKNESLYRNAEVKAKSEKKGIWGEKNYESPYLFRKRHMR